MLGTGTASLQDGHDVLQGLPGLGNKVIAFKALLRIPADLAADKQQVATREDAVGIAFGFGPVGWLKSGDHGVASKGVWR